MATFRFEKDQPKDFGLKPAEDGDTYVDKDGSIWRPKSLWDNGWGNETGFVRLPELEFEELWTLLTESKIADNQRGAALFLNERYPFELKEKLKQLFSTEERLSRKMTKRLKRLELGNNVSEIVGKRIEDIVKDYQEWQKLKKDFERLGRKSWFHF